MRLYNYDHNKLNYADILHTSENFSKLPFSANQNLLDINLFAYEK